MLLKALAYVTREHNGRLELLVYDHRDFPEAGVMVPGGGIDPGETAAEAVLREVAEEAGLTHLDRPTHLGQDRFQLEAGPAIREFFHVPAPADLPDTWAHTVSAGEDDAGLVYLFRWVALPLPADHLAEGRGGMLHRIG